MRRSPISGVVASGARGVEVEISSAPFSVCCMTSSSCRSELLSSSRALAILSRVIGWISSLF